MLTKSLELHGLPADLLREYLAQLGGTAQPDGTISGDGWTARLTPQPDYVLGKAHFTSILVEMQGEDQTVRKTWAKFILRISRPGG